MATDQFCLRWNNFQVNITSALESLKNDEDLVDVTLTCEGQNVKAHKIILSACSPYFRNVFKENPCQHPVVILKDVKYEDVMALLNFMYHGEVYISQDRLASFLHTAELLQVRGLTGAASPFKDLQMTTPSHQKSLPHQHVKLKKNIVQSQCEQLHHATPPLSISPSVPLTSSLKTHKPPRSPITSSIPKDLGINLSVSMKERSKDPLHVIPNRDTEDHSTKPSSPLSVQGHHSSASGEPPSTLYSTLYTEQPNLSKTTNLTVYQPVSNETGGQLQPVTNVGSGQSIKQSSSTSSLVAKRRKAFPRRISSQLSLDQSASLLNVSNSVPQESTELTGSNTTLRVVSVKIEHCDEEISNEAEDQSVFEQENPEDVDMGSEECNTQGTESFDDQILEEQNVEDEIGENVTAPLKQSMLLRSLSGQPPGISQTEGNTPACSGTSGKMAALPHVPQCGTCPHCGQTYSNQSALKYHVRLMHTDMTNRHCCHLCPRSFALRDVFKAHMWSKHKQRC